MREIKFRGRIIDDAQWVVGNLIKEKGFCRISDDTIEAIVVPDSVGQFTGLLDVHGKEIYEGDIIKSRGDNNDLSVVRFGEYILYNLETEEAVDYSVGWYTEPVPDSPLAEIEPFCLPAPLNKFWISHLKTEVVDNEFNRERRKIDVG